MRNTNINDINEDNKVYMEIMPEYGYVPQNTLLFNNIMDIQKYEDSHSLNDGLASQVIKGDIPDCVEESMRIGDKEMFINPHNGMKPSTLYGGRRVPIGSIDDTIELYKTISTVATACAYSGMRVHISTVPMSRVDYSSGEIMTIEKTITEEIPFFETENSLVDIKESLTSIFALEITSRNLINGFDNHIRVVESHSNNFPAPSSRIYRNYDENVGFDDADPEMIMRADQEFTQMDDELSELISVYHKVSSVFPKKSGEEVQEILDGIVSTIATEQYDNNDWIVDVFSDESSMPGETSEIIAQELVSELEDVFGDVEESETLNMLEEQILDIVRAYKSGD
jgi:hypothetical protein